jgi:hypothetical protein
VIEPMSRSLPPAHAGRQLNFLRRAVAHAKLETVRYHLPWPSPSAFGTAAGRA